MNFIIPHPKSQRDNRAYPKVFKGIYTHEGIVQALSRLSVIDPNPLPPKRHNDAKHECGTWKAPPYQNCTLEVKAEVFLLQVALPF